MKKLYISAITAALLASSAIASDEIKAAGGTISGDVTLYGYTQSVDSGADNGYTNGSVGIGYESDSMNGFKASIAARANVEISEENDGDYGDGEDFAVSTANISYSNDAFTVVAGRQAIDLEWIGDYHTALVGVITAIPDTTIVVGHTEEFMAVDADAPLSEMTDIGADGAEVIDVKYTMGETTINPYFMNATDIFSAYGLKVSTQAAGLGITAQYAATSEDIAGTEDGSIMHLELSKDIESISLTAGYVTTDKDGGTGSISALGDNIDPFEDGGNTYGVDSDTIYVSASTELSGLSLGAFYGSSSYADSTDSEFYLTAGTTIADSIDLEAIYASTINEDSTTDSDKLAVTLTYSF